MVGAPGEIRTPDRSIRSPTGKTVSLYKSTICGLDQLQNVVISSVNEPYLVLCWYIIATYASQQAKSAKADARELAVSGRNVPTTDSGAMKVRGDPRPEVATLRLFVNFCSR